MIPLCPICRRPMKWELARVGDTATLSTKCFACDPSGPWAQEPVDIVRKPRGKAGLWPASTDVPFAPVDDPNSLI